MESLFLKTLKIHADWEDFLTMEVRQIIFGIEKEILPENFTPRAEKVLRFLTLPLSRARIVIVGQDPYPQPGVATGRAFEVGSLKSWNEPFSNISLKNILRAVYKAYSGQVVKFNDLRTKFDNEFPVLPPNRLFEHWEGQGVFLLNTSFTCSEGQPGSHKKIWEEFSRLLFSFIGEKNKDIVWFLWGAHAVEAASHLFAVKTIILQHPMMCFDKPGKDDDFLYGKINCFEAFKNEIDWTGFSFKNEFRPSKTLF